MKYSFVLLYLLSIYYEFLWNSWDILTYFINQGIYSLSGKALNHQISWKFAWRCLSYRSEIWQASRQRCCRGACQISECMMTSWNGNIFRVTGHLCGEFTGPRSVISSHKGQWCGALVYSLICVWINGWVNTREAGDLRDHRANYDVIVMDWKGIHANLGASRHHEILLL